MTIKTLAKQIKTSKKSVQKHYDFLKDSNLNLFLSHSYVFPQFFLFLIPSMHQKTIGLRVKAFLGKEKGRKASNIHEWQIEANVMQLCILMYFGRYNYSHWIKNVLNSLLINYVSEASLCIYCSKIYILAFFSYF